MSVACVAAASSAFIQLRGRTPRTARKIEVAAPPARCTEPVPSSGIPIASPRPHRAAMMRQPPTRLRARRLVSGRSGCTSSPSSEQSSQGIAPGCSPGEEIFLPTHTLPASDPRGLGDSAHSSFQPLFTPSSGAGAGRQPLYRAGMVFYPPSGAGGRDGLQQTAEGSFTPRPPRNFLPRRCARALCNRGDVRSPCGS